jgi:hypothetical protein
VQVLNKASKIITLKPQRSNSTWAGKNALLQNLRNLQSRTAESQINSVLNNFAYAAIHIGLLKIVGVFYNH